MDFLVVPTVRFKFLYVLIFLSVDRRRILHFGVTQHPTADWTAQQVIEAFPWGESPKYLLRDRDAIYGCVFQSRVKRMGIKEVLTAVPPENSSSHVYMDLRHAKAEKKLAKPMLLW